MKISITEKQMENLRKHIFSSELSEESPPPPSTVTNTTTTDTSTSSSYPQVGKWESGVTRGPGNQIGNTKWSDVVGASLKRGKGNPLK